MQQPNLDTATYPALQQYLLHLADTALILAQVQSEWCGHGPQLEQDIAITNISLDVLGQARNWYQYAATLINDNNSEQAITEDTLAYFRTERDYKNLILCELPNGDWAHTILRLYFFAQYQQLQLTALQQSSDATIAAIASKSLKENTYHLRWSAEWVLRLGDGTSISNQKINEALTALWPCVYELFIPATYENELVLTQVINEVQSLQVPWVQAVNALLYKATLPIPLYETPAWQGLNGKQGIHTEHMGYILTELQYLQRTYPNCNW